MATYKYKNNSRSTLNGAINDSTTSVVVASATSFPTAGDFYILVDSEIMKVTSVSGATFTVARGSESTAPASHADGATVYGLFSAAGLDQLRSDICTTAAFGSRSAAEKDGRIFFPNDGFTISRDTGSAWREWGPIHPLTVPVSGNFAWINQGSATITDVGSLILFGPASATNNLRVRKKAAPSVPYTITALIDFQTPPANVAQGGILFRESSSGKMHGFALAYNTGAGDTTFGLNIVSSKWTDATNFSASYSTVARLPYGILNRAWLRISDDNTNRILSLSINGLNWFTFHSIGRTDFLTANEVGFYVNSANSLDIYSTLHSWKES